jgi:hypothetical protein
VLQSGWKVDGVKSNTDARRLESVSTADFHFGENSFDVLAFLVDDFGSLDYRLNRRNHPLNKDFDGRGSLVDDCR